MTSWPARLRVRSPHVEGIEVGAQAGGDLPADDEPGEDVADDRDVHRAGVGADVRAGIASE